MVLILIEEKEKDMEKKMGVAQSFYTRGVKVGGLTSMWPISAQPASSPLSASTAPYAPYAPLHLRFSSDTP